MKGGEVLVVVGTRPEAIKMAPVVHALRAHTPPIPVRLLLTGQHDTLATDVLRSFGLTPDGNLQIMREGQTLYQVARGCMEGIRDELQRRRPRLVLVQGDTASVFFGALTGFFEGVPVGHVEAGLRSGDMGSPFPEEGFRRMTGVLARLHFAPTEGAARNLLREGIPKDRIHTTGNPVVDALVDMARRIGEPRDPAVKAIFEEGRPFALLTTHRRESWGAPLEGILGAVRTLVDRTPDLRVLVPVHPNPRVREPVRRMLGGVSRIHLTSPLAYEDLVLALSRARLVLTDSGGIQEEAPTFGVPLLVLREVTERPEGVEAGVAELVGSDPGRILEAAGRALAMGEEGREQRRRANPYGDGRAAARIARVVGEFLEDQR